MEPQELHKLISQLTQEDAVPSDVKEKLIQNAGNPAVMNELKQLLLDGKNQTKLKVIDILANILSAESFELLMLALKDHSSEISDEVVRKLNQWSKADEDTSNEARAGLESLMRFTRRDTSNIEQIFKEREKRSRRKQYFLPLVKERLKSDPNLSKKIRGNLLSILAYHNQLDDIENLLSAVHDGAPDLAMFAANKLQQMLLDETTDQQTYLKIRNDLSAALKKVHHPDVVSTLQDVLDSTKDIGNDKTTH